MASLFQFSVRGMLWTVTILAVGIAALVNANAIWQGAFWGFILYVLTVSLLLIAYRRDQQRAYWLGFAIFGWLYLLVFLTAQAPSQLQFWIRTDPLRYDDLPATQLAQWSYQKLLPPSRREAQIAVTLPAGYSGPGMAGGGDMVAGMPGGMMAGMGVPMAPNPSYVPIECFTQIFHALALLLVAAVGGKSAQVIFRTRPQAEE